MACLTIRMSVLYIPVGLMTISTFFKMAKKVSFYLPIPLMLIFLAANLYENLNFALGLMSHPKFVQIGPNFVRDSQTLSWIKKNETISEKSVITGPMAFMAMIYVGTNASITNHPQFETSLSFD